MIDIIGTQADQIRLNYEFPKAQKQDILASNHVLDLSLQEQNPITYIVTVVNTQRRHHSTNLSNTCTGCLPEKCANKLPSDQLMICEALFT